MESEGLSKFLETVGDAVYSVNTICVGLSSVRSGTAKKPDDLTISWTSSDPEVAADKARRFALRGSLVFVQEALLEYMKFLRDCLTDEPEIRRALECDDAVDRIIRVSKHLSSAEPYWCPMVVLLVRWRNKVVHQSKTKFEPKLAKVLRENAMELRNKHANIDIEKTLEHFNSGKITLKDFTTLIAITVRYARALDEELEPRIHTLEGFKHRLEERNLIKAYNQVMNANGEATKRRKLKTFLKSEFPMVTGIFFEDIYKNGPFSLTTPGK